MVPNVVIGDAVPVNPAGGSVLGKVAILVSSAIGNADADSAPHSSSPVPSYAAILQKNLGINASRPDRVESNNVVKDCSKYRKLQKVELQNSDFYEFDVSEIRTDRIIPKYILIGGLLGYGVSPKEMEDFILRNWKLSDVSAHLRKNGIWSFQFGCEEDLNAVLEHEIWLLRGRFPLALKRWCHGDKFSWSCFDHVPAWIRIYDLDQRFKSDRMLNVIASMIGEPISLDDSIWAITQDKFIRMMVVVSVKDIMKDAIVLKSKEGEEFRLKIHYEWIPYFCEGCVKFGHLDSRCLHAAVHQADKEDAGTVVTPIATTVLPNHPMTPTGCSHSPEICEVCLNGSTSISIVTSPAPKAPDSAQVVAASSETVVAAQVDDQSAAINSDCKAAATDSQDAYNCSSLPAVAPGSNHSGQKPGLRATTSYQNQLHKPKVVKPSKDPQISGVLLRSSSRKGNSKKVSHG